MPPDTVPQRMTALSLDGGGAKGVYALGVLLELEAMLGRPLRESIDLIYGTSTGAIIAAMVAAGTPVGKIVDTYMTFIPDVMSKRSRAARTAALRRHVDAVFGDSSFSAVGIPLGVVATNEANNTIIVFKSQQDQAHGRRSTFVPGFGCTIATALMASCAAFPHFEKQPITTSHHGAITLIDGGFSVNNPTLLAIADCITRPQMSPSDVRVLSVGVGHYPISRGTWLQESITKTWPVRLFETTLASSTNTIEQLRRVLFPSIAVVRMDCSYLDKRLATNLLESSRPKLLEMFALGRSSFGLFENDVRRLLDEPTT